MIKITDILAKGGATEKTAKAKTDDAAPAKKSAAKKAPAKKGCEVAPRTFAGRKASDETDVEGGLHGPQEIRRLLAQRP